MSRRDFYSDAVRRVQDIRGSSRTAQHLAEHYVSERLDAKMLTRIQRADCFWLATADRRGRPQCSYKGGMPGFVKVLDEKTICFPNYDGNGMYLSLGNIIENPFVGLLFIDEKTSLKLRINGCATVSFEPEDLAHHPGSDAVVMVVIDEAFENCPRYLHDRKNGTYSKHAPRPGMTPPLPEWKLKPEYEGILPAPAWDRQALDPQGENAAGQ